MLLGGFFFGKVVGVFVSFAVPEFFQEFGRRVAQVQGNREIAVFPHIVPHLLHRQVDPVVLGGVGKVIREPTEFEFCFGHSYFFADVVDHVGVQKGLWIGYSHIFGGKINHSPRNVTRIFAPGEHSSDVVDGRVAVGIAQRFVHGRNRVVMVVAVAVVCEGLSGTRGHVLGTQGSFALNNERLFENREREP